MWIVNSGSTGAAGSAHTAASAASSSNQQTPRIALPRQPDRFFEQRSRHVVLRCNSESMITLMAHYEAAELVSREANASNPEAARSEAEGNRISTPAPPRIPGTICTEAW